MEIHELNFDFLQWLKRLLICFRVRGECPAV